MENMEKFNITKVVITRILENKWHIWFASCILNSRLKINNIAIFKKLDKPGYRLVFPEKKIADKKLQIFFPITSEAYFELEKEITSSLETNI